MAHVAGARADEPLYGATADVPRPIAAGSDTDPTASATVVDTRERLRAIESMDEIMLEVPGARATRLGGYGDMAMLSLRGADMEHTTVLFGEIPLGSGGAAFDLATVPPSWLERVEVYRGGAPAWLGAGAIGGVVRLVPREQLGRHSEMSIGLGSFGLATLRGASTVTGGWEAPFVFSAVAGLTHSAGNFPYFDDGGTAFDTSDDIEQRRRNAEVEEGHALAQARTPLLGGSLSALAAGFGHVGGLPGPGTRPTKHTRRALARTIAGASWQRSGDGTAGAAEGAPWMLDVGASVSYERSRVTDAYGEMGLGQRATDDRTLDATARAAATWRSAPASLTAVGTWRIERRAPENAFARVEVGGSTRHNAAAVLEGMLGGRLGNVRAQARASASLETSIADLVEARAEREGEATHASAAAPALRVAGVVEPWRGIAFSGSFATATRQPTVMELFGDGALVLGDTRLRAERSRSVDGGVVARGRHGVVRGGAELRVFALAIDDLIRYTRTSQYTVVPENVARATTAGVEVGMRGEVTSAFALVSSATWMTTEDDAGRALPLRPQLQGYVRPELRIRALGPHTSSTIYADLTYIGGNFVDAANLVALGPRVLLGAGAAVEIARGRVAVAVSVRDLLDTRGADVLGFPLPGRSLAATLELRTEALQ